MTNSSRGRHVAVLPFPFSSHAGPILSIIRRLASATPDVTFSFFSTPESIQTLFPSGKPENNVRPYAISEGVPEGYVFSAGKHHEEISLFLAAGKESFAAGMKVAEAETGQRIDCVVADAFMWFSCELAEEMRVKWIALWTSGACALAAHCYTDLIRETVGMHDTAGRENEIVKFVPGFSEVRLGDLPGGIVYGNLESTFSMMLYKMGQVLHKATAVAINSFDELEPEPIKVLELKFQKLLTCGPFNSISPPPPSSILDEYGCIPWLGRRKPASVAYIGFGSVATLPPVEIAALAEALEASSTPFLWSLKDNFKQHLPEQFLKRTSELGKIVPWAPQGQVLAHSSVGVFITHCGWNSVLESIEAGMPIISRPFFGDQQLDTWMVENVWKIGVRVEGGVFTKGSTMAALDLVLSHERGKELRGQVGKYKEFALKAFGSTGRSTQNLNTLQEIVAGYNV